MAAGGKAVVQLRRYDTSQPWGFRMQGGSEYDLPLFIAQVSAKSIAGVAGLKNGDAILKIGDCDVRGWSHEEAKRELIRCGNDIDLTVQRGAVNTSDPNVQAAGAPKQDARSELDEQSINPHMNPHGKYRNVVPKTYQILNEELDKGIVPPPVMRQQAEQQRLQKQQQQQQQAQRQQQQQQQQQPAAGGAGPGPASIFSRKKEDRSQYLVAQGETIQKAYGQSS